MLSLDVKKLVNPQLIPMGLGVFGATFLATMLGDLLERQPNPLVVEYRRELVGAILTVGGTLMMQGSREMRTVGMAIGSTGVAAIASGLTRRFVEGKASNGRVEPVARTPVFNGGGSGGSGVALTPTPPGGYYLIA